MTSVISKSTDNAISRKREWMKNYMREYYAKNTARMREISKNSYEKNKKKYKYVLNINGETFYFNKKKDILDLVERINIKDEPIKT